MNKLTTIALSALLTTGSISKASFEEFITGIGSIQQTRNTQLKEQHYVDSVDKSGNTPLHQVSSEEEAKRLLKMGAHPDAINNEGETPLFRALYALTRPEPVAQVLLENKADPNIADKYGRTPLQIAQRVSGPQETIKLLKRYGAK